MSKDVSYRKCDLPVKVVWLQIAYSLGSHSRTRRIYCHYQETSLMGTGSSVALISTLNSGMSDDGSYFFWKFKRNSYLYSITYSARHLNPTKSNSNGNLTDLVFRFCLTDFHWFPRISTNFHNFPRIFTDFLGFFTDFKQISAVFSSLQLNYIVQKC